MNLSSIALNDLTSVIGGFPETEKEVPFIRLFGPAGATITVQGNQSLESLRNLLNSILTYSIDC